MNFWPGFTIQDLVEAEARTLFRLDESGDMICSNDIGCPAAPRVFVSLFGTRFISLFRSDISLVERTEVTQLIAAYRSAPRGWYNLHKKLRRFFTVSDKAEVPTFFGPSFVPHWTDKPVKSRHANVRLLRCDADNLLRAPVIKAFRDDDEIGNCESARTSEVAQEAGVEVCPSARGLGVGSALATMWISEVRESGLIPFYSTEWMNAASLRIAYKLGLHKFAETISVI